MCEVHRSEPAHARQLGRTATLLQPFDHVGFIDVLWSGVPNHIAPRPRETIEMPTKRQTQQYPKAVKPGVTILCWLKESKGSAFEPTDEFMEEGAVWITIEAVDAWGLTGRIWTEKIWTDRQAVVHPAIYVPFVSDPSQGLEYPAEFRYWIVSSVRAWRWSEVIKVDIGAHGFGYDVNKTSAPVFADNAPLIPHEFVGQTPKNLHR
jgi:hypothetical protein